ncbi:MAG: ribulose 1,5-bisphosphate carboxylase large subunit [Actinomycetota bacterium]|nr:ribulose 1,5-bisphosphate carboxylase large subunit [Actinomycetota bacterium]
MTLAIPPSRGLFGTVRSVAGWTVDTATFVIVLPARIANLLSAVELLLTRISQVVDAAAQIVGDAAATVDRVSHVVDGAETTVHRVSHVVDGAETTVHRVDAVTDRAGGVLSSAGITSAQAQQLLDAYRPIALQLRPMVAQLVGSFSEDELRSAIKLIDVLPAFVEAMQRDIMPILGTLDQVGPDVDALLNVFRDVREGLIGIPGFKFFRKRGEQMIAPEHQPDHPA